MKKLNLLAILILAGILFSCNNDDDNPVNTSFQLSMNGLEDLGANFVYEGWIIVNDNPISTGTFTVDGNGNLSENSFTALDSDLANATKFVLTIEPANDSDPTPSDTKYMAGDFNGNNASLSTNIIGDLSNASGNYILATPTNGMPTNENSGIWFLEVPGPVAGLTLPTLPSGWKYEGWAVINGTPVTTGKFTNTSATDEFDGYSGPDPLGNPNGDDGFFPGEDFLENAPNGLTFPLDLSESTAVISIEPSPDNSPNPFTLKPLVGAIPANAVDHTTYAMNQNLASLPTGTVSR